MADHNDSFVFEMDDGDIDMGAIFAARAPLNTVAQQQAANPFSIEGSFDFDYVPALVTNAFEQAAPQIEMWENDFGYDDAQPEHHHHVELHVQ